MADTFLLEIVTPYRKLLSQEVNEATAPAFLGEIGILPGHTQFITMLRPGEVSYKVGSQVTNIAVGKGYAEVGPDKTILLVDNAEGVDEIDLDDAKATCAKCEESFKTLAPEDDGYVKTVYDYELAQARIKVKEQHK